MQERAWDLWLNCETQQEIADELGLDQASASRWISDMQNGKLSELHNPPESQQHFDVWSFQNSATNAGTPSYFGKLPPQIIENLLWLYTEPGG